MRLSITKLKAFKSCRRMYELRYIEGLEPVTQSEALETGKSYHALVDAFNKGEEIPDDLTKERAMFEAYRKYIAPNFKVKSSEKWLEYPLGNDDTLVGIADGIAEDGSIVEHKTVGSDITEQYEYNLLWDEQILCYMLMTGSREVWYTVIRKPTIRICKNETEEEFYNRMVSWYDTDTDSKVRLLKITRTDEEVENFLSEVKTMVAEMKSTNNYYRNTCHCNMYGRRCEYSSVCLNYNPDEDYIEFIRKER